MFPKAILAVAAAVVLVPAANAAPHTPFISAPPASGRQMHWFHADPQRPVAVRPGARIVLGLESMRDLQALRERYGLLQVRAIPQLRAAHARLSDAAALTRLSSDARVRYVSSLGAKRRPLSMPNDPMLHAVDATTSRPYEWQFAAAHVDRALELTKGSPSIVVGTIDTGLADVPDLAGKVDSRWGISLDGTLTPYSTQEGNDEIGHGTAVASLIAANVDDGFGMAGFGGASHVIAVRVDDSGYNDTAVAIALAKLDSLGVRIVNMSIGGGIPATPVLIDALHKAASDGVLVVAASGNDHGLVAYPAADLQPEGGARSYGLAVGASDLNGGMASFSNSGQHLSLLAPGNYVGSCSGVLVAIAPFSSLEASCYPNWFAGGGARYAYLPGTSFSSPEVAGVAALVWAARPELKNYQVADIIKESARRAPAAGWTPTAGCGILDAGAAVELALSWSPSSSAAAAPCSTAGTARPAWQVRVPLLSALPASGRWGGPVNLRFRIREATADVASTFTVRRNGATVRRLTKAFKVATGRSYSLAWQAPRTATTGAFSFCVTLTNSLGGKSAPMCAPISLR